MAMTVSATSTNQFDICVLKVFVVTHGTVTASSGNVVSGAFAVPTFSMTPHSSNSVIVESIYNAQNNDPAITPNTNNSTNDSGQTPAAANARWWDGHWTGTVSAGTAITTLGGSNNADWNAWASQEVEPSGGTPAIDASTPAAVQGATATTASFSPPAGAILVALVLGNPNTGSSTVTVSDSTSLTWTQRGSTFIQGSGFEGLSAVFTATAPSAATYTDISYVTQYSGWF